MRKTLISAALILSLGSFPVMAQKSSPDVSVSQQKQKTVSGTVVDQSGPIVGASIVVKGTNYGVVTDLDGNFTISMPVNGTLQISSVGYASKDVKPNGNTINVTLSEDQVGLDEMVVVGFGTQKKANLTGSVANVDNKLFENRPITNVSAGLQGLLPGVTVTQRSGQPGADTGTIRVRGTGTLNVSDPMVIVDGVESTMNDIDANDIESISVLKDAASAAIYGSKAANGVILITTKHGKAGKGSVTYAMNVGWQSATNIPEYCTSAEYARLTNQARINNGLDPLYSDAEIQKYEDGSDPYNYPNTDWQDLLYDQSGFQQSHNISLNGGTQDVRYMASLGYLGQGGIIRNSDKNQYNARLNLDVNPIKNLEGSFSMSYSRIDISEPTNPYVGGMAQIFRQVNMISPMVPYKKEDGSYGTIGDGNPIAWLDSGATTDYKRHNLQTVASLKYYILPQLSIKAMGSYKLYYQDSHEMRQAIKFTDTWTQGSYDKLYESTTNYDRITGDILAEYKNSFGLHSIDVLGGFHSELYKYKYTSAYRQNFPSNSLTDLNAGGTANMSNSGYSRELAMLSWLGRVNYDYAGKYLAEANIRYDGTSRFADGHRWGVFPSVSAGWRFSEEEFFESLKETVNNAKLRVSWGKLGNQDIGQGYYPTVSTLTLGYNYPFGGTIQSGAITSSAANKELEWEKTTTWGFGLDLTLINKLNVTLDYYNKTTDGILMAVSTPVTYALSNYYANVGKVSNKGVELAVDYRDRFGKVEFNFGANIAYNKNRIESLGEVDEQIYSGDGYTYIRREGEALNSFFGYEAVGIFQSQEEIDNWASYDFTSYTVRPGDLKYKDQNGDGKITSADRVVLGSWDPKVTFGFNIGANYQGWDIMAFFQGATSVKGYLGIEAVGSINGDSAKPAKLWLDSWTTENTNAKYPRVTTTLYGVSMPNTCSSFWLQDATYLRLKNLQIGYTFPKAWMDKAHISKLRVYYSGQNIMTLTGFLKGWDPEAPAGRGNYYPQTKVHSFGLNLTF